MKQEGTYEAYRTRLNAHRRAQTVAKRQATGPEAYRALQREHYVKRRGHEQQKKRPGVQDGGGTPFGPTIPVTLAATGLVRGGRGEGSMAAPLLCPEVRDCCQQTFDVLRKKNE